MMTFTMFDQETLTWSLWLTAKATVVLLLAVAGHWGLRRAAAATRHLWWMSALLAVLVLPLLSSALPGWRMELPAALAQVIARPEPQFAATLLERGADSTPAELAPAERMNAAPSTAWQAPAELETLPAAAPWTWRHWLALVWLCGVLFVLGRVVLGWFGAWSLRQTAVFVTEYNWSVALRHLSERLRLRNHVELLVSAAVKSPLTCGVLRPAILLPLESHAWPEGWRSVVLMHELAHIKRRDCLTQLMAQFACALFWFHPLVWWAARQLRIERELACDDAVLTSGTRATDYASYLLELARPLTRGYDVLAPVTVGIAGSQLESRVRALLDPAAPRVGLTRQRLALAVIVSATLLLPLAALRIAVAEAAAAPNVKPELVRLAATLPVSDSLAAVNVTSENKSDEDALVDSAAQNAVVTVESPVAQPAPLPQSVPVAVPATISIDQQEPKPNPTSDKSLTVDDLIQMKLHDISPEFVEMLRRNGYDNVPRTELAQLRIHGIDESFIKDMRALGGEAVSLSELVRLRISGVNAAYAQQMKQAGLAVSLKQLSQMRLHGVSPDFITSLKQLGYDGLTGEQLTQLRIHGVTAAYITSLRNAGFENLTLEKVKQFRIHGLTPEFSAAMKAAGVINLSLDDLLKLRIHGISTDFVQRMRAALNNKEISAQDLIRLKISGVDEMLQRK